MTAKAEARLGVIGGSGVYKMDGVEVIAEHDLDTPFGKPSDKILEVKIKDRSVWFLPRHGRGHRFTPTEVNYRANIHALKQLGITHLMAVSAVGIMQEHIKPGDMVIPDQIYDRTKGIRPSTFFTGGIVGHVAFAEPFCADLRTVIARNAQKNKATVHNGGTYVCMEGPQFSTRAESNYYRKAVGATVVGMTAIPEAKLAREAEMCYALLALATDYDCWHESEDDVSVEAVIAVLQANAKLANAIVRDVAVNLAQTAECGCQNAVANSIMTQRDLIPAETIENVKVLFGKYLD